MVVIGVLSGKGGVGKTTVTSNLAAALSSEFKRKVIILDTNVSSSHIRLHFGMVDEIKKTLPDVIRGKTTVSKATYSHEITGVDVVPSSLGLHPNLNLEKVKKIAGDLAVSAYDFVVIDASPGFGRDVIDAINASDIILVVTNPNFPDVSDALKIVELANGKGKKIFVVLNKVKGKKYELDKDKVESMLDSKVAMVIPEDDKVPESISKGVPVVVYDKGSRASISFKKLAAFLTDTEYKPSFADRIKWFIGI